MTKDISFVILCSCLSGRLASDYPQLRIPLFAAHCWGHNGERFYVKGRLKRSRQRLNVKDTHALTMSPESEHMREKITKI